MQQAGFSGVGLLVPGYVNKVVAKLNGTAKGRPGLLSGGLFLGQFLSQLALGWGKPWRKLVVFYLSFHHALVGGHQEIFAGLQQVARHAESVAMKQAQVV